MYRLHSVATHTHTPTSNHCWFKYYSNLLAFQASTCVSPLFHSFYLRNLSSLREINPACLGRKLQRWNWSPGEVIWSRGSPSAWTTVTALTHRFPTRKHSQRAAIFHHTPADPWVLLSGPCTKWNPAYCYCGRSPGDWSEVRWRGQVEQEFTQKN